MSLPVFPSLAGLTFPNLKTSEFNTALQDSPNKAELRISQTRNPFWHWDAIYEYLDDAGVTSDYQALLGLQLALGGRAGEFLFSDPNDNYSGPALNADSTPNTAAELQVITDGAGNYYSPIQRNVGNLFLEDITDLNGSIAVYVGGTLATVGTGTGQYQVLGPGIAVSGASFMGLYLQWGSEPSGTVTAQFNFYFRARLENDSQDFEQFASKIWTVGGQNSRLGSESLKICSSRPVQV